MRKYIRFLVFSNVLLVLLLFFLLDPLHFYPKSYEDAPLWFPFAEARINRFTIEQTELDKSSTFYFSRDQNIWYLQIDPVGEKYLADQNKVNLLVKEVFSIRKFERDEREYDETDFPNENRLRIEIFTEEEKASSIRFGRCFQSKSDCLVTEKIAQKAYMIPFSFFDFLRSPKFSDFLIREPFLILTDLNVERIDYTSDGIVKYSIFKKGEEWITSPELDGKIDSQLAKQLLKRIYAWSGDYGNLDLSTHLKNNQILQSMKLSYRSTEGKLQSIEAQDFGEVTGNKKILKVSPFNQYIVMPSYAWEYWRFYDIKQLLK